MNMVARVVSEERLHTRRLNRLIQGSSADQTKKAMVDCYEAGLNSNANCA